MLETGVASARDIDRAMELGYRHPMGPLKLTDLVGLDVRLAILEHLQREIGEQFRPPGLLRRWYARASSGRRRARGSTCGRTGSRRSERRLAHEAFIVEAVRTPVGRYRGALAQVRPDDLAATWFALVRARSRYSRQRSITWCSARPTRPVRTTATSRAWRGSSRACRTRCRP